MTATRTVKVAIVGSGLAGLTSAYTLSKQSENGRGVHFDVHLFEKVCVSDVFQTTAPTHNLRFRPPTWEWTYHQ
jgi:2-polyprenyl-6-methoxyphenol hydroxylase-like FAD-dependent oxidoreductase